MRFFEQFLKKFAWLLTPCAVFALFFWATQITDHVAGKAAESRNVGRTISQSEQQFVLFAEEIVEKAKAIGDDYDQKSYWSDVHRLEEHSSTNPTAVSLYMEQLKDLVLKNNPSLELRYQPDYALPQHTVLPPRELVEKCFSWFKVFYLRSLFLILLIYLVRMAERKGIVQTILADKKRFIVALFAWPAFVSQYPYNVVREIVVEAELRRLGDLFRKLTKSERSQIQDIANGSDYASWLQTFRMSNQNRFQHGFLLAILVVIIFRFFSADIVNTKNTEVDVGIRTAASSAVHIQSDDISKADFSCHGSSECVAEFAHDLLPPLIVSIFKFVEVEEWIEELFQEIFHVPIQRLFEKCLVV